MEQDKHRHPSTSVSHRRPGFKHTCDCPERKKPNPRDRNWVVIDRYCNYSAFSGYHWTPSDYSALHCHTCGACWRTKADYVGLIRDGSYKQNLERDAEERDIGRADGSQR